MLDFENNIWLIALKNQKNNKKFCNFQECSVYKDNCTAITLNIKLMHFSLQWALLTMRGWRWKSTIKQTYFPNVKLKSNVHYCIFHRQFYWFTTLFKAVVMSIILFSIGISIGILFSILRYFRWTTYCLQLFWCLLSIFHRYFH